MHYGINVNIVFLSGAVYFVSHIKVQWSSEPFNMVVPGLPDVHSIRPILLPQMAPRPRILHMAAGPRVVASPVPHR